MFGFLSCAIKDTIENRNKLEEALKITNVKRIIKKPDYLINKI